MVSTLKRKLSFLVIPLLFLLYSAPGALDYLFFFPDEKYYTDAVIKMMEKDDYFTPYQADGAPRFKKPILTYWVLMASYKMFGVSPFSSRIFFWLAGAALVVLTYFMSKSLSGSKNIATMAAFITAANPLVLMSASRSIPDILLTLFLTVSAWGFLELLRADKPRLLYSWMAYLGAALAFETKGLPAAAFAGISILFLLFNPWKKVKIRQLVRPFPIIISVFVAASWFLIMYAKHGASYWTSFFDDQVGMRVSSKIMQIVHNGGLALVTLLAFLIPWVFILVSKIRTVKCYLAKKDNSEKAIFGFVFSWVVLVILMSAAVFRFYDRYLLPVIPLVSLFLAYVFSQTKTSYKKSILRVFLVLNILVIGLSCTYALFIARDAVLIIGICVAVLIIAAYFKGIFNNVPNEIIISNSITLLYFNVFVLLFPFLMPNVGKQISEKLLEKGLTREEQVFVYGNIRTAANIRVQSNNTINVIGMDTVFQLPKSPGHYLVINKKDLGKLDLSDYDVIVGSEEWKRVTAENFPSLLQPVINDLKDNGSKYYIATVREKR